MRARVVRVLLGHQRHNVVLRDPRMPRSQLTRGALGHGQGIERQRGQDSQYISSFRPRCPTPARNS